jgi:hypothetical protein
VVLKISRKYPLIFSMVGGIILSGCGGGSDSSPGEPATALGQFKDSNVEGLAYVSGGLSGVTNELGEFNYEVGNSVTFSVGAVELGRVEGKEVVTPQDLIEDGDTDTPAVQNIVRFLMTLDADGDPSNGITITDDVRTIAEDWQPVDFSSGTFAEDVGPIVSSVDQIFQDRPIALVTPVQAKEHLESTLRCVYAGAFSGTYRQNDNGSARGNFALLVSARNGDVTGWAWSTRDEEGEIDDELVTLFGTQPINYGSEVAFVSGFSAGGAGFNGRFVSPNAVTGTYSFNYRQGAQGGRFSGTRIAGSRNAVWRFTGVYRGDTYGVFAMDIDQDGNVTGRGYNVVDDEADTLGGMLNRNTNMVSITVGGQEIANGTLDVRTGLLTGTWASDGESGTFSGDGCRLN